jgi:hypothetical protein
VPVNKWLFEVELFCSQTNLERIPATSLIVLKEKHDGSVNDMEGIP